MARFFIKQVFLIILIVIVLAFSLQPSIAAAGCVDGVQSSGAKYLICVPDPWNGDLVVYAHGYVAPDEPLEIPDDQVDGTPVSELVNALGFAYAATSYRINGLAVVGGLEDVVDLVNIFNTDLDHGPPRHIYLVGASEGGLITTLAIEQYPDVFDGGLALCGPVGNFRKQLNYFGDFRVVFDYFFPGLIPGSAVEIPPEVIEGWNSIAADILVAIKADPHATRQLLRVTRAPVDEEDPDTVAETVLGILWYNIFATNDAKEKLGGQPFDNTRRFYFGSDNDFRLNRLVQRFSADRAALDEIEAHYQTSGRLTSPLVTLHTKKDPIVPYWHEPIYSWKTFLNSSYWKRINIPIFRYGHCNFEPDELIGAFMVLVLKVAWEEMISD